VLSKQLTGMALVVRACLSEKDSVTSAINQLRFAGANLLGFVLNGIAPENAGRNKKYLSKYGYHFGWHENAR
jgi:Mrp family chromosome partitioning ATPase